MSWSGPEDDPSGSEMMSDSSVFGQLKKMKLKQAKKVEQADFDKLFARGMEMSAMRDENTETKKVQRKRNKKVPVTDSDKSLEEAMKQDNGIGYEEKVMSYLDDQAKAEMLQSEVDSGHVSRSRRKQRQKAGNSRTASESEGSKAKKSESRNRSREYSKPEDIKLSPVIKRDLFTGEIISVPSNYKSTLPLPAPPKISTEEVPASEAAQPPHTQTMAPSPGKHFLEATTGQEVFGASIEGDNPELAKQLAASEHLTNGLSAKKPAINSSAYDAYESISAGRKKPAAQPAAVKVELAADRGIPTKLKPDKLLANEEFYEELRESMRKVEASQEDPEGYHKYTHHLGRAEFGTLKKRTSTLGSAATSRDPSGDRINLNRSLGGVSRDPSGDRLALATKQRRLSAGSGVSGLPDLELDTNIPGREQSGDRSAVHRTVSLLLTETDIHSQPAMEGQLDMVAKRDDVLREIEEKKLQIREAKAWIQNGLMTVVGFGVMAYLQTLESMGP